MAELRFVADDAAAMREFGVQLARILEPGAVVLLHGPLGAGKTVLAQGIAAGLGVPHGVSSPSFVLVREYSLAQGLRLLHMDFYRLASAVEVVDLGVVDDLGSPDTIALIEWPEHAGQAVPEDAILIRIEVQDDRRQLAIRGLGPRSRQMVRRLGGLAGSPAAPARVPGSGEGGR